MYPCRLPVPSGPISPPENWQAWSFLKLPAASVDHQAHHVHGVNPRFGLSHASSAGLQISLLSEGCFLQREFRPRFDMADGEEPRRMPDDPRKGSIQQAVEIKDLAGIQKRVMYRIIGDNRQQATVSPEFAAVAIGLMMIGALGTGLSMYLRVSNPFAHNAKVERTAAEAYAALALEGGLDTAAIHRVRSLTARWQHLKARREARRPHLFIPDVARAQGEHVMAALGGGRAASSAGLAYSTPGTGPSDAPPAGSRSPTSDPPTSER